MKMTMNHNLMNQIIHIHMIIHMIIHTNTHIYNYENKK
jgi:hypothetical protein